MIKRKNFNGRENINTLFMGKWFYVFIHFPLNMDICISDISKSINCTYAHASFLINDLANKGFFRIRISGRKKLLIITVKGSKLRKICLDLESSIK